VSILCVFLCRLASDREVIRFRVPPRRVWQREGKVLLIEYELPLKLELTILSHFRDDWSLELAEREDRVMPAGSAAHVIGIYSLLSTTHVL
jgi:hypothetical protein